MRPNLNSFQWSVVISIEESMIEIVAFNLGLASSLRPDSSGHSDCFHTKESIGEPANKVELLALTQRGLSERCVNANTNEKKPTFHWVAVGPKPCQWGCGKRNTKESVGDKKAKVAAVRMPACSVKIQPECQ